MYGIIYKLDYQWRTQLKFLCANILVFLKKKSSINVGICTIGNPSNIFFLRAACYTHLFMKVGIRYAFADDLWNIHNRGGYVLVCCARMWYKYIKHYACVDTFSRWRWSLTVGPLGRRSAGIVVVYLRGEERRERAAVGDVKGCDEKYYT